MEKKQKRQVEEYLNQVGGKGNSSNVQSLPAVIAAANNSLNLPTQVQGSGSSAPVDPESPLSVGVSSTATSLSEVCNDLKVLSPLMV